MRLVLIRGLPGSGKSTYAARAFPGTLHLENDLFHRRDGEYRFDAGRQFTSVKWCMETADAALGHGMDVVVSNTFTRRRYVEAYRRLAVRHGAEFRVIRMMGDYGTIHAVPDAVLKSMREGFEDYEGEETVG